VESTLCQPVPDGTQLIETFRFEPGAGFVRLTLHLARMAASAKALGFPFNPGDVNRLLDDIGGGCALRCRLTLSSDGSPALTTAPMPAAKSGPWALGIAKARLNAGDPWLGHKSTNRALYDACRANMPAGVDELLFLNQRGEVCEGTITNVFVTLQTGETVTPPTSSGLLAGVYRQHALARGDVGERIVTLADLHDAQGIYLVNSLRGRLPATLLNTVAP